MPGPAPRHYHRPQDPQALQGIGPIIEVTIALPETVRAIRAINPNKTVTALIDTGASNTVISEDVVRNLSLHPVGKTKCATAHGERDCGHYVIDFTFTNSGIWFPNARVLDADLAGQPYEMLIGRDVLSLSLFIYDGVSGGIGLEVPGNAHPLKHAPWTSDATPQVRTTQTSDRKDIMNRKARRKAEKAARRKQRRKG